MRMIQLSQCIWHNHQRQFFQHHEQISDRSKAAFEYQNEKDKVESDRSKNERQARRDDELVQKDEDENKNDWMRFE